MNTPPTPSVEGLESRVLMAAEPPEASAAVPPVIDLMVLYTPLALRKTGGTQAIRRQVRRAVADTNQVLANSEVDVTIRLVRVQQIDYEEPTGGHDLFDGFFDLSERDDVSALRERYGADVVTFWFWDGVPLGIAGGGFNAVVGPNANNGYLFTHEVGHNLSAGHTEAFRINDSRHTFGDVMSTSSTPIRTVPFFSNPDVTFHGVPLALGGEENNAANIRLFAPSVASYMPTRVAEDASPIASLGAVRLEKGGRRLTFDVRLLDDIAVDVDSLSSGDVRVEGPKNFDKAARLVKVDRATNGAVRTATYRVSLPSAARSPADYRIVVHAGAIADVAGNALKAATLRARPALFPALGTESGIAAHDFGEIAGKRVRVADDSGRLYGFGNSMNAYRFKLGRPSFLTAVAEGLSESQRIELFRDTNGDETYEAETPVARVQLSTGEERLGAKLRPGTYFLVVDFRRGPGRFALDVSAVPTKR